MKDNQGAEREKDHDCVEDDCWHIVSVGSRERMKRMSRTEEFLVVCDRTIKPACELSRAVDRPTS